MVFYSLSSFLQKINLFFKKYHIIFTPFIGSCRNRQREPPPPCSAEHIQKLKDSASLPQNSQRSGTLSLYRTKKGSIKPSLSLRRTHSFFVPSHAPARSLRRKAFIPRSPIPAACLFPSIALREGVRQATKQAATEPRRRRSKRRKTRRRPCLSETDARSKR